jgi:hypothetical protein
MRTLVALALTALAFVAMPASAQWLRAESPNFVLYSQGSESRLRERILLLEDFDRLLRALTAGEEPAAENKLRVYIVQGNRELNLLRPVGPHMAEFYTAAPEGIAAFVDGRADATGNHVLFHEYAHHFLLHHAPHAYPAWYVEGFAEFLATVDFARGHIDIGRFSPGRAHSLVEGRWLPMERVLTGSPRGLDRDATSMFYAQSWLATHYFLSSPERQAMLWQYMAAFRGDNPQEALRTATGMTPEAFDDELRRYIRGGRIAYRRMERALGEARPAIAVTRLTRAADDFILHAAALGIGVPDENGASLLEAVRAAAARHHDDPFARRVLAHSELLFGDSAAADRLLEALLVEAPGDAELMYLKGLRHLQAARDGDPEQARLARTWFTRAHNADGNNFQTLYRFAESFRGEREFLSENTRNVMLLAHQLAPQVAEIRMNAALLLIARRETAHAEALLRPLAADPHHAGVAEAAQRLIDRAQSGDDAAAASDSGDAGENDGE